MLRHILFHTSGRAWKLDLGRALTNSKPRIWNEMEKRIPSTTPVLQLRLVIRIHQVNDATRLAIAQGPPWPPWPPWPPRDMPWPLAGTMPLAACRWPSLSCASAQGSQSPSIWHRRDMSMSNHKHWDSSSLSRGWLARTQTPSLQPTKILVWNPRKLGLDCLALPVSADTYDMKRSSENIPNHAVKIVKTWMWPTCGFHAWLCIYDTLLHIYSFMTYALLWLDTCWFDNGSPGTQHVTASTHQYPGSLHWAELLIRVLPSFDREAVTLQLQGRNRLNLARYQSTAHFAHIHPHKNHKIDSILLIQGHL